MRAPGKVTHATTGILALLLVAFMPLTSAAQDSCKGIGPFAPKNHHALDPFVAKALKLPDAKVRQVFERGSWRILYATSSLADGAYVFYAAPPAQAPPVTVWAGAARTDEKAAIEHWVRDHAAGIPDHLVTCFATYVTTRRSM